MSDDVNEFGIEEIGEDFDVSEVSDIDEFNIEEISEEPEEYSKTKAAALGALEGATFGFADEIGAAGQALYGELTGRGDITEEDMREAGVDPEEFPNLAKQKSLLDRYREIRDLGREGFREAQEQQPGAFFGGSMVGGAAIPGMGAVRGTRAAAKSYKAARLAGKSKEAARQAAGLSAMAQASKVGAGAGGIAGAGISEADLTKGEVGDFTEDVGQSAAIGAGLAGPGVAGVKAAGRFGKGVVKGGKELPIIKQFTRGTKEGLKGRQLYTQEGRELAEKGLFETSEELTENIKDEIGKQAQRHQDVLEGATGEINYKNITDPLFDQVEDLKRKGFSTLSGKDARKLANVADELEFKRIDDKMASGIKSSISKYKDITRLNFNDPQDRNEILNAVNSFKREISELSGQPSKLQELGIDNPGKKIKQLESVENLLQFKEPTAKRAAEVRRFLQQYTIAGDKSLDTKEGRKAALDAVGGLKQEIETAVGTQKQRLQEANDKISKLLEAQGLLKTDQPTYNEIQSLKNTEAFSNWLSRGMEPGSSGMKTRFRLRKVKNALQASNPDIAENVMRKIDDGMELTQALAESGADISGFWQAFTNKFPSLAGNVVGYKIASGQKDLSKFAKNLGINEKATELSTQIRGMVQHSVPEDLQQMSQKFYDIGEEQIGNAFRKASGMKNERRRQAILMGLMQQPKVREILKDEELGETQDEQ